MRALLLLVLFLATTITHGSKPEDVPLVYDVTTIYRLEEPVPFSSQPRGVNVSGPLNHPGSMEVHARTNARGLPFVLPDGAIRGPEVGISVPECSRTTANCGWTRTNFTMTKSFLSKKPPLITFDRRKQEHFEFVLSPSQFSEARPFHSSLRFSFKTSDVQNIGNGRSYLAVFLMAQGGQVHSSDMYYLRIRHKSEDPTYLVKCTPRNYDRNYYLVNDETRRCSKEAEVNLDWDFTPGEVLSFSVTVNNGRIILQVFRGAWRTTLFDWTDSSSSPIDVTQVAFGTSRLGGILTAVYEYSVLELTNEGGTMLSPPLPAGQEGLCVSLIFYAQNEASIELQLNHDNTTSTVWTNSEQSRQTGAWSHVNVNVGVNIPNSETVIVVVKATKQTGSTLLIQRVAGCNAEEPEDVLVLPEETSLTVQSPGADIAHSIVYNKIDENTCRNGGIKVVQKNDLKSQSPGCICPAGFTGENCEKACGANSYGADCDGVCSETERGCRGMILCLPVLGCDCAPGYKGLYCNSQCERREYGAGCRQSCGKCAGGDCDIYSGVCHQGCLAGHFPPLCNETYSHVSLPPRVVVADSFYNVSVSVNLLHQTGFGDPQFYQVQYKEENATEWQVEVPQPMPTNSSQDVTSSVDGFVSAGQGTGLKPGTSYILRVVLIDKSGAIYQGEHVPTTTFTTSCTVPETVDYNADTNDYEILDFVNVSEDGFELAWQFPSEKSTWCPVIGYEVHVKMGWQWKTYKVPADVRRMIVDQLLPGRKYTVKVRAVTTKGAAAFSQPRVVTTQERAPDHVVDLKADEATGNSLTVSWSPPRHPAGTVRWYQVTYKCLHLMACPEEDCSGSAGYIEVISTSVILDDLLPYALYNISVAGFSVSVGPASSLLTATIPSVPAVEPTPAHPSVVSRTNSSLSVQWGPPASCRHLHGYLRGYRYELVSSGQKHPLMSGATTNCSATFNNLKPYSDFVVRVYVDNSDGWSTTHPLEIHSKTKGTTPESVEDLTVYKRGRRMLGLRWSPPRRTYGTLQSFTITHRPLVGSDKPISVTIKPSPCPAWPQLYCHTLSNLKPETEYTMAVEPRNSEVDEDGIEATIVATTKEGAPGAPSYLRVKNQTDTTLTVEWGLPDLINGHLRSFLVNIEETDSFNSSDCCQYFPIREVVVTSEDSGYEFQMTGLKPASSYEVSVSAKTVAMGAAVTLTGHTRPPTPVLTQAPTMAEPIVEGSTIVVHVEPATGYQDELVSGYLLLLKDDHQGVTSHPITNEWLSDELSKNRSISLVAEFTQSEVTTSRKLELHPGRPKVSGRFGLMGLPTLTPGTQYRLVWAVVLDYCGTLSVGQILGDVFTVDQSYTTLVPRAYDA